MRWEAGEREPRMDEARKIAKALHTTIAFLTGEGDNSDVKLRVATPNSVISLKQNGTIVLIGDDDAPESNVSFLRDFVYVPIMSPRTPACCGLGNGLEEVPMEADGISLVECDKLGFESRAHKLGTAVSRLAEHARATSDENAAALILECAPRARDNISAYLIAAVEKGASPSVAALERARNAIECSKKVRERIQDTILWRDWIKAVEAFGIRVPKSSEEGAEAAQAQLLERLVRFTG
jgi:hypothetical protein